MKRVISNTGSFFLVDNENRKRKSRRARKREGNVKEWKSASRRQGIIIDSPGKANAEYGITLVTLLLRVEEDVLPDTHSKEERTDEHCHCRFVCAKKVQVSLKMQTLWEGKKRQK